MSQIHPEQQKLVTFLQDMARKLIGKQAFFPTGASLAPDGQLILEYIQPVGSAFETRKQLHAKLVEIAKGGQTRAVGLCHSMENPQIGTAVVVCVDHVEEPPVTFIFPVTVAKSGEVQFSGEPIVQGAAYAFFRFVRVTDAQRLLPGRWQRVVPAGDPAEEVVFQADQSCTSLDGKGTWQAAPGDFFTMLVEETAGGVRERRLNELTERKLVLQSVEGGRVRQAEFTRLSPPPPPAAAPRPVPASPVSPAAAPATAGASAPPKEDKPWWKFW